MCDDDSDVVDDVNEYYCLGEIPSTIGDLSQLKHLYLFSTQLIGEIPASIGLLQQLTEMEIDCNNLTGNYLPLLPLYYLFMYLTRAGLMTGVFFCFWGVYFYSKRRDSWIIFWINSIGAVGFKPQPTHRSVIMIYSAVLKKEYPLMTCLWKRGGACRRDAIAVETALFGGKPAQRYVFFGFCGFIRGFSRLKNDL